MDSLWISIMLYFSVVCSTNVVGEYQLDPGFGTRLVRHARKSKRMRFSFFSLYQVGNAAGTDLNW
jgi:hypothetical protein